MSELGSRQPLRGPRSTSATARTGLTALLLAGVVAPALAACGAPGPAGTVRSRSEPWTGVAAYCWPLPGGPTLPFRWLVAGVRPAHGGTSTPRTVTVQVVDADPTRVAADLDRALPASGWRRTPGAWPAGAPARFVDRAGRAVTIRVGPLPGALPDSPVTADVVLELPPGVPLSRTRPPCPDGAAR